MPDDTAPRRKIIIDCDPGQDDMAAIILAAASAPLEILALTTVSGNAALAHTTQNALELVAALRLDIPVHAGAALPLHHRHAYPREFHGDNGMGTAGLPFRPAPQPADPRHAVMRMIELIEQHPGQVTLVALAPLTNLALLLGLRPDLAPRIAQIVFMGGSTGRGNITPAAEFNIWADPEAASMVMRSGARLAMFGLNVTERALFSHDALARVRATAPAFNPVADALHFYMDTNERFNGPGTTAAPLHDACPVAYLLDPDLFRLSARAVHVITERGPGYGMTLVDQRGGRSAHGDHDHNVAVAMDVEPQGLERRLEQALCWAARRIH